MSKIFKTSLVGLLLMILSVLGLAQENGPVPESFVFVVNGTARFDDTFTPTFVRDVDNITVQFTFRNSGSDIELVMQLNANSQEDTSIATLGIPFTCQRVDGPMIDADVLEDCSTLTIPAAASGKLETTVQLTFFSGNLPGSSTASGVFELQLLATFSGVTAAVIPIGAGEKLVFNLSPSPPSVSIEGPVTLDPPLPRQGQIVTASFIVANNKASTVPFRLTFELRQLGGADFLAMDFLRVDSNCARCVVSGTLRGNERLRLEFKFITSALVPTFDPLDATKVTISDAESIFGNGGNGDGTGVMVSGTVEAVTQFDHEVFVLLNQGSQGRIWIRIAGSVRDSSGALVQPEAIRTGMLLSATLAADRLFESAPLGRFDPAETLINPYLLRITANPEQTNTINQIVVGFNLRQPIRPLTLRASASLATAFSGDDVNFNFSVFNDSALFLKDNFVEAELVKLDEGGESTALIPLDAARCALRPLNGELLGLIQVCNLIVFDLAPFQTTDFQVALNTENFEPGRYQFRLRAGPTGVSEQTAQASGLSSNRASVGFRLEVRPNGTGTGNDGTGTENPVRRGPELRPTQLQIVPSATVEQGRTLVLLTTIKNNGNLAAENIEVAFSLAAENGNDNGFSTEFMQFFPRLGIGLTVEARQAFETAELAPGRYRIRVEVRLQDEKTIELDPGNNVLEALINVVEKPSTNGS